MATPAGVARDGRREGAMPYYLGRNPGSELPKPPKSPRVPQPPKPPAPPGYHWVWRDR